MSRVHDRGRPGGPQRSRPPPRGPARPEPPRARPAPGARRTPARERSVEHGGGPPSGPSRVRLGGTVHGRGGWGDARVLPRIPPSAGDRPLPPSNPRTLSKAAVRTGPAPPPLFRAQALLDEPQPPSFPRRDPREREPVRRPRGHRHLTLRTHPAGVGTLPPRA